MITVHDKVLNILETVAERILSFSNTRKGYIFEVLNILITLIWLLHITDMYWNVMFQTPDTIMIYQIKNTLIFFFKKRWGRKWHWKVTERRNSEDWRQKNSSWLCKFGDNSPVDRTQRMTPDSSWQEFYCIGHDYYQSRFFQGFLVYWMETWAKKLDDDSSLRILSSLNYHYWVVSLFKQLRRIMGKRLWEKLGYQLY